MDDLDFTQNFSKIRVERGTGGEATLPGPPRIHVLLDLASQWSEVPTPVVATSREVDTAHQSPPSTAVASTGEVARVLGQDVPSTVVADVVSESNHGEGSGVRRHRRLVLVQREVESDTDSVRSEPSEMTSVGGISERGEGVEVIDPTLEAPPLAFIPRVTQHVDASASLDGVMLRDVFDTRASVMHSVPYFLKGSVQRSNQGGPPRYPQRVRTLSLICASRGVGNSS